MKKFEGRVAVITGGASGIGLAIAKRLAAEKVKLVLADVELDALERAGEEIEKLGATVLKVPTDVSKPEQVEALAKRTVTDLGGVHIVCNNAGVGGGGVIWESSLEDWEWVFGVNLWGVIYGIRTFVPIMLEQDDEGHVVNTASFAGLTSNPFTGIYSATKHAVVAMSEVLHHELALRGSKVKASVLCPAWVNTNIIDSHRNRPAGSEAKPPSEQDKAVQEMVRTAIRSGLQPEEVASKVFDAMAAEQFYILTHTHWNKALQKRFDEILAQRNPTFVPPA